VPGLCTAFLFMCIRSRRCSTCIATAPDLATGTNNQVRIQKGSAGPAELNDTAVAAPRLSRTANDKPLATISHDGKNRVRVGRGLVGSVTPIPFSLIKVGSQAPRRKNDNVTYTQETISDRGLSIGFMGKRMRRSGLPERTVTWPLRCRRRGRRRNEHWYVWLYGTVFYFATLGRPRVFGGH
jgi:hypothetical protein